jgi:hypothetical protein
MKKLCVRSFSFWIVLLSSLTLMLTGFQQRSGPEPWTEKQLMAPEDLAGILNNPAAKKLIILSIGPGAVIRESLDIGPAHEKEKEENLKLQLAKYPKDADLVIYCGCCPFEHCPNIRPAFTLLNEMKFTNARLLDIRHNIKTDWIDRGFPVK